MVAPTDPMDEWNAFVDQSPQGSIFCRTWWLDAVCPGSYAMIVARRGGRLVAGMAMRRTARWGVMALHMPPLTQTLGPLFAPPASTNYQNALTDQTETLRALIQALPRAHRFNVHCHYNFTNWLPFYWDGFRQTTLYTYAFDDLTDLGALFDGFHHSKRKNLKRAEATVEVREDLPARDFYAHHAMTLGKGGDRVLYSEELFCRLHAAATSRGAGKTWYAVGADGAIHAAIFVVFDARSAYYLVSSIDPDHRNSGATTLLIKRAIEYVAPRTRRFDFEGSMIEGVETSFRRFGARQVPYFAIMRSRGVAGAVLEGRDFVRRFVR